MNRNKRNSERIARQQSVKPSSLEGRNLLQGVKLAVLVLFVFVSGCDSVSSDITKDFEKIKETKSMEAAKTSMAHTPTIPPIDASVSTRLETATFALG